MSNLERLVRVGKYSYFVSIEYQECSHILFHENMLRVVDTDLVPQLLRDLFFLGMSVWTHPVWRRKQSLAPQVEGEAGSQVTMATRLSLGASRYLHTKNKKAQSTTDINTPAHLEILPSVLFLRDAGSSGR